MPAGLRKIAEASAPEAASAPARPMPRAPWANCAKPPAQAHGGASAASTTSAALLIAAPLLRGQEQPRLEAARQRREAHEAAHLAHDPPRVAERAGVRSAQHALL